MKKVDVNEFARLCGKSDRYIRNLCNSGKLPHEKEQVGSTRKEKYMIFLDSRQAIELLNPQDPQRNPEEIYIYPEEKKELPEENRIVEKLVQELIDTKNELIDRAYEAGQVKLLEDNLRNKQKDEEHWKEEYFRIKFEKEQLEKENIELRNEVSQLKNKSFLSFFKK